MHWRRRLAFAAAGIALATSVAALWTWHRSEAHLTSFAPPPPFTTPIPTTAAARAHGQHLAITRGCNGCHGDSLEGGTFHEDPLTGRAVGANLTAYTHAHTPAVFERALRHGIGHDGRALYSMPAYNFTRLTNADVAALYAHIHSLPVATAPLPSAWLGPAIRWAIATGTDAAIPAFLPKVPQLSWQSHPEASVRRGEYLAMTSCNECHGFGLRGDDPFNEPGTGPPDLAIVASYDKAAFTHLMRTGKPPGNRDLGLMTRVARGRFAHWTPQEVDDLYAFLSALGKRAAEPPAAGA